MFDMTNDEDEEIQSIFRDELPISQSDAQDSAKFYDSEVNWTASKMDSVELAEDLCTSPIRRFSHRRSTHLTHSRSESLPVAPRVPHVPPVRHDKVRHFAQSPLYKFAKIRIKQDPFLSPIHASDELLSKLPTTYLVVSTYTKWRG